MPSTLGLQLPTVGGSANVWGTILNIALNIVNTLGGVTTVNVSSAYNATFTPFPQMLIRVTTGGLNIPINLPPASTVDGKSYIVKKVDAGLGVVQVLATDTIDNQPEWDLANQYAFVSIQSNGSSYDVIGSS